MTEGAGVEVGSTQGGDADDDIDPQEILEDAREDALDFLEGLLDAMEAEGDVSADIVDGGIVAEIVGGDVGLLIGGRGQTLEAIQELLRTVIQRQAQTRVRVTLDVEGYRQRRREAVSKLAEEMIAQALDEGEVELEPMNAYERKIVHEAVAAVDELSSFSEGQEPRRRVVIRREE